MKEDAIPKKASDRRLANGLSLGGWSTASVASVVACAVALVYASSIPGPLVLDDLEAIKENSSIRSLTHFAEILNPAPGCPTAGRPIANFTFALNYAIGGLRVEGYHALNIVLHFVSALVLFGILWRTLDHCPSDRLPGGCAERNCVSRSVAASIVFLWAVHPILTEAVSYISQRTELLMGLAYLTTFYAFIRGVTARSWGWLAMSVVACFAGMACKEVMITAPVLVLLYDRAFFSGSLRGAIRDRPHYYLALAASWIPLAFLLLTGLKQRAVGFGLGVPWWNYALTEAFVVPRYVSLIFWPHSLTFDYGMQLVVSAAVMMSACVALAVLLGLAIFGYVKRPRLSFPLQAFFVLLLPTSSVVPIAMQPMAESRLYLPSIALLAMAVVSCRAAFVMRVNTLMLMCALCALPLAILTCDRNAVYRSPEGLWRDSLIKQPTNARAAYSLALIAESSGCVDDALRFFETTLKLKPDYDWAQQDYGRFLLQHGFSEAARIHLEAATKLNPRFVEAFSNLGVVRRKLGDLEGARHAFERALALRPDFPEVHYNLANTLFLLSRFDEARDQFLAALRFRPDLAEAHNGLGLVAMHKGNVEDARSHFQRALELKPDYAEARQNLLQTQSIMPSTR